jgi:hypothetical protein
MRILKQSFQVPQKLLKNSKLILKPLKHLSHNSMKEEIFLIARSPI